MIATVVALGASSARAATLTWNGATADWLVGTNWTPAGPPGTGDVAVVNAGNAQLGSDTTIAGLTQGGGTVSGAGVLTVTSASTWTAGTQNGTGTTQFSDLSITGATAKSISGGRTVVLNGTTTWSGNTANNNNNLVFATGTLTNAGTFNDSNAFGSFLDFGSGTNAFNNNGTYNKTASTVTLVEAAFFNAGVVNVNAGSMLMAGVSTSTGTFNLSVGTTLEFRNGQHTLDNATLTGAGTLQVSTDNVGADASVTINGGTLNSAFLLSGSTLGGTDQVFGGPSTWTGGTLSGTASTTFNNDLTISGANLKTMVGGRTVNLNGTTTWTGNTGANNNAIRFLNGATLNNNGTFNDENGFASFIEHSVGGPHNFNNSGTYNKLSNTITTVDGGVAFNNTGTVNVQAGTFRPSGGGTSTGVFNISAGATLNFQDGASTLNGATTSGAGTFHISSDNIGGDAVVNLNGGTHTTAFVLSGSTLAGADHTFQGGATWTGGAISGAAATTFATDVTISGPNLKTMVGGRTVNLNGTTTWTGNTANNNNAIRFWNGATLNNNGTFNDENGFASFIEHNVGGPHNFNNIGTYNKQTDTVTTVDLGVNFNNTATGSVNVNAGRLAVNNAFDNLGVITTANGATFATLATGSDLQNHGVLQGFGTYDPGTGRATLNAGQVQPGTAASVGALTIDGHYTQTGAGLFEVNLASISLFDSMDVLGNLTLDGVLRVSSLGGYTPVVGDSFTIITFDDGSADVSDLSGVFASLVSVGFHPSVVFGVSYLEHAVVLNVIESSVPEPSVLALLGVLAGVALARRRLRR